MQDPKVLVALDYQHEADAFAFIEQISPAECRLKVGKEMFTLFGPQFVRQLVAKGFDVFLDLKFHDIPNTVARATAQVAEMGATFLTVHAYPQTMRAARSALGGSNLKIWPPGPSFHFAAVRRPMWRLINC